MKFLFLVVGLSVAVLWVLFLTRGASLNWKQYRGIGIFFLIWVGWISFMLWFDEYFYQHSGVHPVDVIERSGEQGLSYVLMFFPGVVYALWYRFTKEKQASLTEVEERIRLQLIKWIVTICVLLVFLWLFGRYFYR